MSPGQHLLRIFYTILIGATHRYGQMTAGSYCYIGPQGIVHGTTVSCPVAMCTGQFSAYDLS